MVVNWRKYRLMNKRLEIEKKKEKKREERREKKRKRKKRKKVNVK